MLVKLTPGVNFINILLACFSYASAFFAKTELFSSYILAKKALSYEKCACKMLVKLTPGGRRNFALLPYSQSSLLLKRQLGSISPLFYKQLLCAQIPKVQNNTDDLTVSSAVLGSTQVIAAASKHVGEIYP